MLLAGKNIQSSSDKLIKVSLDYLYHSIRHPKPKIASKIKQLRIIYSLDKKRYAFLKKQLPYIVCGQFNPPFRRSENFVYIKHFIIDLDHLKEKQVDIPQLKQRLQEDKRLVLCFISPSEDGLKLLFSLKERCMDSGIYSLFYNKFVQSLSLQYGLEQIVDKITKDVSRACFISMDENCYYNPEAESVDINDYLNLEDTFSLLEESHLMNKQHEKISKEFSVKDPDDKTLEEIKVILGTKSITKKKEKLIFVPEQLNEIIEDLKIFIENKGILVYEILNIQYAKKIRCKLGKKTAEINLFYGKKGFSVVQSPSCGTSEELNNVVSKLIELYLEENILK